MPAANRNCKKHKTPLEHLEVSAPCWHLSFSPMTLDTSLQNHERTVPAVLSPKCGIICYSSRRKLIQARVASQQDTGCASPGFLRWDSELSPRTWVGHTHVCVYAHAHTHIYIKQRPPDDLPCYILKVGPWSKYRAGILWGSLLPPPLGWRTPNIFYLLQWKGALGKRHPRATIIDAKDLTVAHSLRSQGQWNLALCLIQSTCWNSESRTYSAKHRMLPFEVLFSKSFIKNSWLQLTLIRMCFIKLKHQSQKYMLA